MAHEVAHTLGRLHAPCGAPQQVDPKYPYAGGAIGMWGYDFLLDQLVDPDPSKVHDVMSYCQPVWISDYNYAGLFTRIAFVRKQAGYMNDQSPPTGAPRKILTLMKEADGSLRWGNPLVHMRELPGEKSEALILDKSGHELGRTTIGSWDLSDTQSQMIFLSEAPPNGSRLSFNGRVLDLPNH
jgi:hypothetical protein